MTDFSLRGGHIKTILVTGAAGFIGRNLVTALKCRTDVVLRTFGRQDGLSVLETVLDEADIIFHLAGINRPEEDEEFVSGNVGLTREIIGYLKKTSRTPMIIYSSSSQASLDNPYGRSKKVAEEVLLDYKRRTGASVYIYRLPGVFGKWSRPNYNSVVATFCHNIARGLDITISDADRELELVYIDDVVTAFCKHLDDERESTQQFLTITRSFRITLGNLANRIRQLHAVRKTLVVPDQADDFMKCLHATYLSFLPEDAFAHPIKLNVDNRGWLFELIKSKHFGQIFVSKTLPGITRGCHYHNTKIEKFCLIQGEGVIRFRHMVSDKVLVYPVNGIDIKVVDIPPGYAHSIENIGSTEMIVLFWANHVFDPEIPDTTYCEV